MSASNPSYNVSPNPNDDTETSGVPIGAINLWGGSTAPSGWLLCNGADVSRSTYADLFSVIGTNFGAGNGAVQTITSGSLTATQTGTFTGYVSLNAATPGTAGTVLTVTALGSGSYPVVGTVLTGATTYMGFLQKVTAVLVAGSSYQVAFSALNASQTITGTDPNVTVTCNISAGNNKVAIGTPVNITSNWTNSDFITPINNLTFTAGTGTNATTIVGVTTLTIPAGAFGGTINTITAVTPTTFGLPNTAGRTIRGIGSAVGTTGTTTVTLGQTAGDDGTIMTYDQIAQHSHQQNRGSGVTVLNGGGTTGVQGTTDNVPDAYTSATIRNAANTANAPTTPNKIPTLNQYIGINYIIKYG